MGNGPNFGVENVLRGTQGGSVKIVGSCSWTNNKQAFGCKKRTGAGQKGVGDIVGGALIETEARTILNQGKSQGINENKKETALRMLQDGELSIDKIRT